MTMEYLVTGATGFLGRHLVARLLTRGATVHAVIREGSEHKLERLRASLRATGGRLVAHTGDLHSDRLGLDEASVKRLSGRIAHVFHLAALYDMSASEEILERANVEGTRNALALAGSLRARCFHHVSSIAAAGLYPGEFREDMFEQACGLDHPYFRTKHAGEGLVRAQRDMAWRIYRPGMIVGDSRTGEADRVDGPYHLFKPLQLMGRLLPRWLPAVGVEGGVWNIVPVDFVADALDHIAHRDGLDGECFHLTDPETTSVGDVVHTLARAADAGRGTVRLSNAIVRAAVGLLLRPLVSLPLMAGAVDRMLARVGLDRSLLQFLGYPTRFDSRGARAALAGSGIRVPPLPAYAPTLWRYWETHLDPERTHISGDLAHALAGKVVVVTGASSGIGRAVCFALARTGARLVLVARNPERLGETQTALRALGADAYVYACDLCSMDDCDALLDRVRAEHGGAYVLVNNAGHSIRRSVERSYNRFHDFERTMQLNYFGALRLTLGLLPAMTASGGGQVINISSIAVQAQSPRFSAYVASKSALDAFSRSAAGEFAASGVCFTTINMPLVRTPMIAPTRLYRYVPTLTPEQAAALVTRAIVERPERITTPLGLFAEVGHFVAPRTFRALMSSAFRVFSDSKAARRANPVARKQAEAARPLARAVGAL